MSHLAGDRLRSLSATRSCSRLSVTAFAARLSAKLGEGVVNGLMTARIGLSAIDVCRPLPFLAADRPQLKDLTTDLVTLRDTTGR